LSCSATVPVDRVRHGHSDALIVYIGVRAEVVCWRVVYRLGGGYLPWGGYWGLSGGGHVHVVPVPSSGILTRVRDAPHVGVTGINNGVFLESPGQHVDVHVVGVVGGLGGVVRVGYTLQVVYVHVVAVGCGRGGRCCGRVVRSHVHVVISRYLSNSLLRSSRVVDMFNSWYEWGGGGGEGGVRWGGG